MHCQYTQQRVHIRSEFQPLYKPGSHGDPLRKLAKCVPDKLSAVRRKSQPPVTTPLIELAIARRSVGSTTWQLCPLFAHRPVRPTSLDRESKQVEQHHVLTLTGDRESKLVDDPNNKHDCLLSHRSRPCQIRKSEVAYKPDHHLSFI